MYTPQEVQDKRFPKAVFGGYDMGEVDDFLDAVSTDYTALYKENAVLKSKMKVLAEKVEEYRSVDAAMRKALIVAQKMASEMTEEAKAKSDEIRSKARIDYENSIAALKDDIRNEERRMENIREATKKYVEASVRACQQQIESLKSMISEPVEKRSAFDITAEEIEKTVHRTVNEAGTERAEPVKEIKEEPVPDQQLLTDFETAEPVSADGSAEEHDVGEDTEDEPKSYYDQIMPLIDRGFKSDDASDDVSEPGPAKQRIPVREPGKPQEVNVGGMNIRVFEMDLGGDKSSKSGRQ